MIGTPENLASQAILILKTKLWGSPGNISEVVLAADLRCIKCQERVLAIVSAINNDLDSIMVDVVGKKVTITKKPINH
ncbi:hypothetical protein CDL12_27311 [Handroanthus impetiginosus]|uniref:HMA domain-containing protein n=1 Tax=Handroanthus impetiginosus TaxID=429701 RepID=A0A2G9G4W8_9LAMI|nr:hypothetical protein CDL12_27311 [Handroanthus impetiginosus]